jgi:hypothetical protein
MRDSQCLPIRPGNVVAALCQRRKYPLAEGATVIDRRYCNFVAVIDWHCSANALRGDTELLRNKTDGTRNLGTWGCARCARRTSCLLSGSQRVGNPLGAQTTSLCSESFRYELFGVDRGKISFTIQHAASPLN